MAHSPKKNYHSHCHDTGRRQHMNLLFTQHCLHHLEITQCNVKRFDIQIPVFSISPTIITKPIFCLPPQCRPVHNKPLTPPPPTPPLLPAPAWPIFTQWQGSHTVRGDRRGVGRGWLTAVPERMLRDDGWPSRYVMS